MFDKRPPDATVTTSRAFKNARAVVDVGVRSRRMVHNGIKRIGAILCYMQAVIWGIGALSALSTSDTLGKMLFVLALGCLISGGFGYAGKRLMSSARMGKKPAAPPPSSPTSEDPKDHPGHRAVLNRLRTLDATQPEARLQLAGTILFDHVYQLVKGERGARIEDFLAILGSVGGHACIVGALDTVARSRGKPAENQLVVMNGKDGNRYYFGDLPNEALLESPLSLLSLTLGAAQANGGSVSLEKVHDMMRHVASTAGTSEFGIPRIAGDHRPGDVPFNYIKHLRAKLFEPLDLYEVPLNKRASAIGFAVQKAIDVGKDTLDPTIAADIVTECAVPAAKFDPSRFC